MEKIKILTDSCLDIPEELIQKNNIDILPVLINFGDESYLDREEINLKQMLDKIENDGVLPTTAQITPNRFEEYFRKALDEGYKVVAILMSSNMSGTYNSACIAKEMVESDDITIIDTQVISSAQGFFVLKACELRDKGLSPEEIKVEIEKMIPKMNALVCFESLDNLVRGGRISKTAGVVGTVLGVKLVLNIKDGLMSVKDKVRGSKKALRKIITDLEASELDCDVPVLLVYASEIEIKKELTEYLENNNINYIECPLGSTVCVHSGPDCCGLVFLTK